MFHNANQLQDLIRSVLFTGKYIHKYRMVGFFKQPYFRLPGSEALNFIRQESNSTSPTRLLLQIIILQFFYYITAFVLFYTVSFLSGIPFTLQWVLSWELVSVSNTLGLTLIALWTFDSLLSVLFIMIIVGRSKLAWDFAITVHVINLFIVWIYSHSFPTSFEWWGLQFTSCCIMVALGTWSTRWKELRDTFFDGLNDMEVGNGRGSGSAAIATDSHGESITESIAMKDLNSAENK